MVRVNEYFEVVYGANLELANLQLDPNGINFVSRTSENNGVVAKVKLVSGVEPNPANTISVAGSGSVMESFLQKEPYYSGRDLFYLKPLINLTDKQLLYYCMCLRVNKYKFSYGRQANKTLRELAIPSIQDIPTWIETTSIPNIPKYEAVTKNNYNLNIYQWLSFKIGDYFDVFTGRDKPKGDLGEIECNSIENLTVNNGVNGKIKYDKDKIFNNFISVASIGEGGTAFYQSEPGAVFTRVKALLPKENTKLNVYIGLFLVTILNLEKAKYSYGRVLDEGRLKATIIKLPSKEGVPDWQFMEDYIKSLPYSSNL